jgi:xylulokinase
LVRHLDAAECDQITNKLGGVKAVIEEIGNAILPGFTASKILWLKRKEPKNFARLATVLLPHDYLNFWLTGNKVMEYGDASGTALLDVKKRQWSRAVCRPSIRAWSAPAAVAASDQPAGFLQESTARELGLSEKVLVSAGGGDNMMGAIGTGNTVAGVVTASFGTSGTIYACSERPVIDRRGRSPPFAIPPIAGCRCSAP